MITAVELIIGMEIHVELATRSKMFSRAPNPAHEHAENAPPNSLLDPTVLALPGALPVMNREAIDMAILVGLALGCSVVGRTTWARKSYTYPDLPKGYQISQHVHPLCRDGRLDLFPDDNRGEPDFSLPTATIRIERAHLEEDAGKLLHEAPGGHPIDHSIVDLNRAGTPLLEIVTHPDLRSACQAVALARNLRDLCRWLGVTRGVLERGQMRFEPNINTRLTLADASVVETPIVEIKNLNSFRALHDAIEHEHAEQPRRFLADRLTKSPGSKTTRGWDPAGHTFLQRSKEEAHDYRYFPDPDLPPVVVTPAWADRLARALPELPLARHLRYVERYALSPRDAGALTSERATSDFFEACVREVAGAGIETSAGARACARLLLQAGARRANERGVPIESLGITPEQVARIAALAEAGLIAAGSGADELFGLLCEDPTASAEEVARGRGLLLVRDEASLQAWCDQAIADHPQAAADVRAGKTAAIGRLVGAAMKLSGGRAEAARTREILLGKLLPSR